MSAFGVVNSDDFLQDLKLKHLEGKGLKQTPYHAVIDLIRRNRPLPKMDPELSGSEHFLSSRLKIRYVIRAAFILHSVWEFTYAELSVIFGFSPSRACQLVGAGRRAFARALSALRIDSGSRI